MQEQKHRDTREDRIVANGKRVPSERIVCETKDGGERVYYLVDENGVSIEREIRIIITETGEAVFIDVTEAYLNATERLEEIIQKVKDGYVWDDETADFPENIVFDIMYPNGKHSDIDMFIANEYGEVQQIAPLVYEVTISTAYKEQIALMSQSYAGSRFRPQQADTVKLRRDGLIDFLYTYNLYFSIQDLVRAALDAGMGINNPLRRIGEDLNTSYRMELRNKRRKLYAELVSAGMATSKWKSEQQAYAIIREVYPDAIYQYRADWLGFQSLDIFIPSLSVGIEYQGAQHYQTVSCFGGEKGLAERLALDKKKKAKCIKNGVKLIEWRYDEPLTLNTIQAKIKKDFQ